MGQIAGYYPIINRGVEQKRSLYHKRDIKNLNISFLFSKNPK